MTNGRDHHDASDFVVQILIQELLELTPRVDMISWAKTEAKLACNLFEERLLCPWMRNRCPDDPKRDPMLYVGEYMGFNNTFSLSVVVD
jgi:hypothetical protein